MYVVELGGKKAYTGFALFRPVSSMAIGNQSLGRLVNEALNVHV